MRLDLSILDVEARVEAPDPVLAPIAAAYARFVGRGGDHTIALELDASGLSVDGRRHDLLAGVDPTHQLYSRFITALMRSIASHAVLHAAALVGADGRATLIAAPSGFGKSSLAQELARRGLTFLGDDYAPLDLETATIAPYPRAVAIRPHGDAPTPALFRERALRPETPELLGKRLVHVDELLGPDRIGTEPVTLGRVIVLDTFEEGAATQIEIGAPTRHAGELAASLDAIEGVAVLGSSSSGDLSSWRVALDPAARPTEALATLLEDPRVLFSEKLWTAPPDFDAPPLAEALTRRQTAILLGRELLNARRDGRLLARFDGDPTHLFLALTGALAGAECLRVRPGPFAETADLIERFAGSPTRP